MNQNPIVIIGSGLAGYTVLRELRKIENETPVLLLTADHGGFYSKPMLSNALAKGKTPDALINNNAGNMAEQLRATIQTYSLVNTINPIDKNVILMNGGKIYYDQLVLALGANQIQLPINGDGASDVLSVNNLDDYRRFRDSLTTKKEICILGAGLIGCEFANDLAMEGYKVHVIDISNQPLGRLLPPAGGIYLQRKLEDIGITFHLNTTTKRIDKKAEKLMLTFANGKTLQTELLLTAVGLVPNTVLAKKAGLKINHGIVVSRSLQTNYKDIFALGDCAEVEGKVLPFIMPIMYAARALASTLNKKPTLVEYPAMPVLVKTPACPTIVAPPNPKTKGEWYIDETSDGVKALFQDKEKKLLGYALLGNAIIEKNSLTKKLPAILK